MCRNHWPELEAHRRKWPGNARLSCSLPRGCPRCPGCHKPNKPTSPTSPQAAVTKKADSIPVKIEHEYVCGTAIATARQSAIKLYASSWHQSKLGSVQESEQTRIFADCRFPGFWNRGEHLRPRSSLTPMFIGLSVRSLPRDFAKSRLKCALRQILVQSPKLKR
jgi:hypothetical protein